MTNLNFSQKIVIWLVGLVGQKNGRSQLKLILCCFWVNISPHSKFHPNRMKNTEVENFHCCLVLVGRAKVMLVAMGEEHEFMMAENHFYNRFGLCGSEIGDEDKNMNS